MAAIDAIAGQRQVLKASAGTLSAIWYADGVPVDPGATTVGMTNLAGTVVLATTAASTGTGSGQRTIAYTTTHTAQLDTLTVTWTSATYGAFVYTLEVVGAEIFTIYECQTFDNNAVLNARPVIEVSAIEEARVRVLDEFEGMTGVAWVPRYRTDIYNGCGTNELFLATGRVRSIRSVAERASGGTTWTAYTQAQLDDLIYEVWGLLRREAAGVFLYGTRNVRIGYEHGADGPTQDIKRAALMAVRYELLPRAISDRAISTSNELGSTQYWTPGISGRGQAIHELPYVDRVLRAHSEKVPAIA